MSEGTLLSQNFQHPSLVRLHPSLEFVRFWEDQIQIPCSTLGKSQVGKRDLSPLF